MDDGFLEENNLLNGFAVEDLDHHHGANMDFLSHVSLINYANLILLTSNQLFKLYNWFRL